MLRILSILLLILLSNITEAQKQDKLFNKKRKDVEVSNYSLFLHLHDLSIEYSSRIEYSTDSLIMNSTASRSAKNNFFDFRIRLMQTLQHALYKSDPVLAFLDGWAFGMQMEAFLKTDEAQAALGPDCTAYQKLFADYLEEFPDIQRKLTGNDPAALQGKVRNFADQHPISGPFLNRASVTDATAKWVGDAAVGFKSGVATLTDAMRSLSDRANFYTEFTPKMTQWYVEQQMRRIIGGDSLANYAERSISAIESATQMARDLQPLLISTRDMVMSDIERQRLESLSFMTSERKSVMNEMKSERQIVLAALSDERMAIERMVSRERELTLKQAEAMALTITDASFERIEGIIDKMFLRMVVLMVILGVFGVAAMVVYKKM